MRLRSTALIGALLLSLAGCRSGIEKADAYEAQYDRLIGVGAHPAARISIQQAIRYDDTNPRRYLKLAEVNLAMNQAAAAGVAFQQVLDLQPDNIEALQNLSMLAARGGKRSDAVRYIEPLLALSPNDPAGLLSMGAISLAERKFEDASKLADQVIVAIPDRAEGYILKARALDGLGRTQQAIALLRKQADTAEDPKSLLAQLMLYYRKSGNLAGIRATAIRMMPLFPDDPRYAFESARAFNARGDTAKVREVIDDLARRFATNPDVLVAIVQFWRDTLPPDQARNEIVQLAGSTPPNVRPVVADALTSMGDPQTALRLLEPFVRGKVTSGNVDAQARYARALFVAGRPEARARSDAVLDFDLDNATALLVRARLKLQAKDFRGAVTDAQLVVSDDDRNEEAALLVPLIYAAQGNNVLAAGAFGNARQHFPQSATISKAEVNWLLGLGRNEEAAQHAASFLFANPRNGMAAQTYRSVCAKVRTETCRRNPPRPTR